MDQDICILYYRSKAVLSPTHLKNLAITMACDTNLSIYRYSTIIISTFGVGRKA
jgi:hypothetical protein